MPTNRRHRRNRRLITEDSLPYVVRFEWESGRGFAGIEMSQETYEAYWKKFGEKYLADWIQRSPGTRPFAWWVLVGVPENGERPFLPGHSREQVHSGDIHRGIAHTCCKPSIQERQAEWLERHGYMRYEEIEAANERYENLPDWIAE